MGNFRSEIWHDDAGTQPVTGRAWRVCEMVTEGEALLGPTHSKAATLAWQTWYSRLSKAQRGQTDKQEACAPAAGHEGLVAAPQLVEAADDALSKVLKPGKWPSSTQAEAFVRSGELERVLALYSQAMLAEPEEAAYPHPGTTDPFG